MHYFAAHRTHVKHTARAPLQNQEPLDAALASEAQAAPGIEFFLGVPGIEFFLGRGPLVSLCT